RPWRRAAASCLWASTWPPRPSSASSRWDPCGGPRAAKRWRMAADPDVAVIGGGPAGLVAAELLSARGLAVTVFERMPTVGRKFLMAGRGGLNLTHSEGFEAFVSRYGEAAARLRPWLEAFPPPALIAWAEGLGQPTFTGSSGRVFPKALKA